MSTDIVGFQTTKTGRSKSFVELAALQLYLAISLPLVFVTLVAWYGVYWWETRKETRRQATNAEASKESSQLV